MSLQSWLLAAPSTSLGRPVATSETDPATSIVVVIDEDDAVGFDCEADALVGLDGSGGVVRPSFEPLDRWERDAGLARQLGLAPREQGAGRSNLNSGDQLSVLAGDSGVIRLSFGCRSN